MSNRTPPKNRKPSTPKRDSEARPVARTPPIQRRAEPPPSPIVKPPGPFLVNPLPDLNANQRPRYLRVNANPADVTGLGLKAGDLITIRAAPLDSDTATIKETIGLIWPSFSVPRNSISVGVLIRLNADLQIGAHANLSPCTRSIAEASALTLRSTVPQICVVDDSFSLYVNEVLVEIKYLTEGTFVHIRHGGKLRQYAVENVQHLKDAAGSPPFVYQITRRTRLTFADPVVDKPIIVADAEPKPTFESIGGLGNQIQMIKEMVQVPLQEPERYSRFGLKPPRGLLLFGPPGTGKTLIARAVGAETGAHVIVVNGAEILGKFYGETESKLRDIFDEAKRKSPSIIFIDEIDALCPKRDEATSEVEKRIVATLLTLLDGVDEKFAADQSSPRVVLLAATNRPNALDEALRRPGRLDREIEIGIPTANDRQEILRTLLRKLPHSLTENEITQVAAAAHGYVGADLAAICREAGLKSIRRAVEARKVEPFRFGAVEAPGGVTDVRVGVEDLLSAMTEIKPSAMREISIEVPKVYWQDIGGQDEIKQKLKEAVEWPLKHPEAFARFNIRPPKGLLLYGPPGCSKTLMAKALATEAGLNFLAVKGPELFSKWVGESEKAVRDLFKKARAASPSIVFFDEIDALAVRRGGDDSSVADRVLSQLLADMDGIEPLVDVTVVAATNRPDIIDSALLRPGRIDRILYVAPPDRASRLQIFRIQVKRIACSGDVDLEMLADMTEGFSGAECVSICQEAGLRAMEEDVNAKEVSHRHFEQAAKAVTRQITKEMIAFYDDFRQRSGLRTV